MTDSTHKMLRTVPGRVELQYVMTVEHLEKWVSVNRGHKWTLNYSWQVPRSWAMKDVFINALFAWCQATVRSHGCLTWWHGDPVRAHHFISPDSSECLWVVKISANYKICLNQEVVVGIITLENWAYITFLGKLEITLGLQYILSI